MGDPKDNKVNTSDAKNKETSTNATNQQPVTVGTTSTTENNTVEQKITRPINLYVMIPYNRPDQPQFNIAAAFKKDRVDEQLKASKTVAPYEIWYKPAYKVQEFKDIWMAIAEAVNSGNKYNLREVHFFGHSDPEGIYFTDGGIGFSVVPQLQVLKWSPIGTFVLHSCRSGRFEDMKDELDQSEKKCIANVFSDHLQVKVVGQCTYASFHDIDTLNDVKHRYARFDETSNKLVLWGYNIGLTTGASTFGHHWNDSDLWNMAFGQIWPARAFIKGKEQTNPPRIVRAGHYNELDLEYI